MSEVKLDETGLTTPSISLGDNTLSSEGNKLLWNGEEFKSGAGGHNVGEQWVSMDGTIPFGGLPFLGQTVSKETYIELYNWVETNGRFKTEAEWQTLYTANNGNVAFYSKIDDSTFRLPSFKGYLKANESAGGYTKEGLPNITGRLTYISADASNIQSTEYPCTGAFRWVNPNYNSRAVFETNSNASRDVTFDASLSNSIYGKSSHVTPETNTILIGVYAFNTVINDSDIEVDTLRRRVDEFETLSKHAVGEQWISMDGTIPKGGVPFNGQILNIADYQTLYNWAKDNGRIKTESEWQTLKTNNNSNVAYYSDYSDTQFRMPLFRGYLKADSASGYIKQGLPNITGTIDEAYGGYGAWGGSGAFSIVNGSNVSTRGGGGGNVNDKDVTFNASRSNAIYGRSSNVTPETSKMLVGVYAFNTVVNAAILDATDKITSDILVSIAKPHIHIGYPYSDSSGALLALRSVNYTNNPGGFELLVDDGVNQKSLIGKADGTFTWAGKHIMHLNGNTKATNWYRKYSDGLIIQSGTIATTAGDRDTSTITLPTAFTSATYYANVMLENVDMNGGGGMWTVKSKTTTSFIIHNGQDTTGTFRWFAIGY